MLLDTCHNRENYKKKVGERKAVTEEKGIKDETYPSFSVKEKEKGYVLQYQILSSLQIPIIQKYSCKQEACLKSKDLWELPIGFQQSISSTADFWESARSAFIISQSSLLEGAVDSWSRRMHETTGTNTSSVHTIHMAITKVFAKKTTLSANPLFLHEYVCLASQALKYLSWLHCVKL